MSSATVGCSDRELTAWGEKGIANKAESKLLTSKRPMPRPYTRNTLEQRSTVLAAASAEGLTAQAVHARFGVNPHTYYAWRRNADLPYRRGRRPRRAGASSCRPRVRVA